MFDRKEYMKKYYEKNKEHFLKKTRTKEGLISKIYATQKQSSKRRNHELPSYTKKEFSEWMYKQENFNKIYEEWKYKDYKKDLVPSVDRIDDYKGYSLDNIKLVTFRENYKKSHEDRKKGINNKQSKIVLQYDLKGNFIKEWYSISEAERNGFNRGAISRCCKNFLKKHRGYIWKYKL